MSSVERIRKILSDGSNTPTNAGWENIFLANRKLAFASISSFRFDPHTRDAIAMHTVGAYAEKVRKDAFPPPEALNPWIITVARNKARDEISRKKREAGVTEDEEPHGCEKVHSHSLDTHQAESEGREIYACAENGANGVFRKEHLGLMRIIEMYAWPHCGCAPKIPAELGITADAAGK